MYPVATLILHLGVVAFVIWLFDTQYRRFRVDLVRHQLFGLRDALFEAAREEKIQFSNPAYRMTRQTINGMIRFAEDAGLWRMLFLYLTRGWWANPETNERFSEQWREAKRTLTAEEADLVNSTMMWAHVMLFSYMAHTSLILFPVVFVVKVVSTCAGVWNQTLKSVNERLPKHVVQFVDGRAYENGAQAI